MSFAAPDQASFQVFELSFQGSDMNGRGLGGAQLYPNEKIFLLYLLGTELATSRGYNRIMTPWSRVEISSREGYQGPIANVNVCGADIKCR